MNPGPPSESGSSSGSSEGAVPDQPRAIAAAASWALIVPPNRSGATRTRTGEVSRPSDGELKRGARSPRARMASVTTSPELDRKLSVEPTPLALLLLGRDAD